MRTRGHNWYDTKENRALYGIQVLHPEHGWLNASEGGKPLIFKTAAARDAKRAEVRKWKPGNMRLVPRGEQP